MSAPDTKSVFNLSAINVRAEVKSGVRPEIQGLRAAAVLLVLIYHFTPTLLPGGYAGVDVFFVISGFLITSHLLREVTRTGTINLPQFWARRARRLLPASLVVVAFSAVATIVMVPVTFWRDWSKQMVSAVAYVLNWFLASDSVDYLAAENNASPVQHYWSLSVEEQFYLVWPLLILLALWIAKRLPQLKGVLIVALGILTATSLLASIVFTAAQPAAAYFVSVTRAWEFGLGGLLTFVPSVSAMWLRSAMAWLGVAGIVVVGLFYTNTTPFPGYTALLPTLATAAVIVGGLTTPPWSFAQVARFRPIMYVGDVSYSLYLWHWPLIVFFPFAVGRPITPTDSLALFAISIALAAATKRYLEDPIRAAAFLTARRPRVTVGLVAAAMAVSVIIPTGAFLTARSDKMKEAAQAHALLEKERCRGAAILSDPTCAGAELENVLTPGLAALKDDTGKAYDCYSPDPPGGQIVKCAFGSTREDAIRVAITGDSHAAMLVDGLTPRADDLGWTIDTYVGRGCTWADPSVDTKCAQYRESLQAALLGGDYDLIITTEARNPDLGEARLEALASSRIAAWDRLISAGTTVLAVADNPRVPDDMVDCVILNQEAALHGTACVMDTAAAMAAPDSLRLAAEREPRAELINLDDLYCTPHGCPMVVGNTTVYRDQHHLTATYMATVTPILLDRVREATQGSSPGLMSRWR